MKRNNPLVSFEQFINEDRLENALTYTEKSSKKGGPITNLTAVEIREEKILTEAELERLDILDKVVTEYEKIKQINDNAKKMLEVKDVELREAISNVINESDKYLTVGIETYNTTLTLAKYTDVTTVKTPNYEKAISKLRESAGLLGVSADDLQAIIDLVIEETQDEKESGGRKPAITKAGLKNPTVQYRTDIKGRDAVEVEGAEMFDLERELKPFMTESRRFKKINENLFSLLFSKLKNIYNSLTSNFTKIRSSLTEANKLIELLGREPIV